MEVLEVSDHDVWTYLFEFDFPSDVTQPCVHGQPSDIGLWIASRKRAASNSTFPAALRAPFYWFGRRKAIRRRGQQFVVQLRDAR